MAFLIPNDPGLTLEHDGPLLRLAGQFRGLVTGPRDLGVDGPELDALIARQRDFFATTEDAGQAVTIFGGLAGSFAKTGVEAGDQGSAPWQPPSVP